MALRDGRRGRRTARLIARQVAVLLARRPEGDVLGAELVVEEFLQGKNVALMNMKLLSSENSLKNMFVHSPLLKRYSCGIF